MSGEEENVSEDVEPSGIISVHIGIKQRTKVTYLTFTYTEKRFEEQVNPQEEKSIKQDDIISLSKDVARKASCRIIPFKHLPPRNWSTRDYHIVTILEYSTQSKEHMRKSRRSGRESAT